MNVGILSLQGRFKLTDSFLQRSRLPVFTPKGYESINQNKYGGGKCSPQYKTEQINFHVCDQAFS